MNFSPNNQSNVALTSLAPVFTAIASRHRDNRDEQQRHDIQRQDARRSDDQRRAVVEKQIEHQNKTQHQERIDDKASKTSKTNSINSTSNTSRRADASITKNAQQVSTNTFATTINTIPNTILRTASTPPPPPQAASISPQQIVPQTISQVIAPIISPVNIVATTIIPTTQSTTLAATAVTIFNISGRIKKSDDEREDENDDCVVSLLPQINSQTKKPHVAMEMFTSLFPNSAQHTALQTNQNIKPAEQQNNNVTQDTQDTIALVQRVVAALQSAANRGDTIRIRMHPESLGSVAVRVRLKDGKMQATLRVENRDARSLLLSQRGTLRDRLAKQQIDLTEFNVEFFTDNLTERDL